MLRRCRRLGLALLLGLGPPACKPKAADVAEVKTLDNFAAGSRVRTNLCGAPDASSQVAEQPMVRADDDRIRFDDTVPKGEVDRLKKAISETLTAVPPEMQVMFMDFGGYIDVSKHANERCTAAFTEGEQKTPKEALEYVSACFTFEYDQGKGTRFRINLAPVEKEIRHGLLRTFGYVFAQFVSRLGEETRKELLDKGQYLRVGEEESGKFLELKEKMTVSFLKDMATSTVFDLKTMESMLGPGSAEIVKRDQGKLTGVDFRYPSEIDPPNPEQKAVRKRRFLDYVFAESFDSYYCRAFGKFDEALVKQVKEGKADRNKFLQETEDTRKIMQAFFPDTFASFQKAHDDMRIFARRVTAASPLKKWMPEGEGAGLALNGKLGQYAGEGGMVYTPPMQQQMTQPAFQQQQQRSGGWVMQADGRLLSPDGQLYVKGANGTFVQAQGQNTNNMFIANNGQFRPPPQARP